MKKENIFSKIPDELPDELFETLVKQESFTLERIISMAHATPKGQWYDQEKNEWVILLTGTAGLRLADGDELIVLEPGDHLFLPAHCKHRVEWTAADRETIWLALHY